MREMTTSKTPWISEYPADWDQVPLHALFGEHKNKNKDGAEQNLLSLSYGNIIRKDINTNEGLLPESFNGYNIIDEGDIVLRLTDLQNDHRSLRTGLVKEHGIITSAYVTLRKKAPLSSEYYHYLLHAFDIMKVFYSMGEGIRQSLGYNELAYTIMPRPSISEQQAIVRYLDSKCFAIDEAIERHKKIIEKLEEYRNASITSAVTRSKTANHYKPSKTYAHEIPDYWEETNLGNLVYSMRNGYVGPTRDILVDEGVRYIQSLHVKNGKLFFENGPFYVTEMWGNVHPKIKTGDLLIVQTGDIGQVAVVTEEYNGCNCHALIIARTRTDIILPEYLAYYCRSRVGLTELLLTATGATLPHLNSGAIKYSTVIIPPISEQKEIIDSLHEIEASIDKHIEVHESIIIKLEEYRKSIIYNAVTGKIDCREAVK